MRANMLESWMLLIKKVVIKLSIFDGLNAFYCEKTLTYILEEIVNLIKQMIAANSYLCRIYGWNRKLFC